MRRLNLKQRLQITAQPEGELTFQEALDAELPVPGPAAKDPSPAKSNVLMALTRSAWPFLDAVACHGAMGKALQLPGLGLHRCTTRAARMLAGHCSVWAEHA